MDCLWGGILRVIGIDPGTKNLGYGILDLIEGKIHYHDCGVLVLPTQIKAHDRFAWFDVALRDIFTKYKPQVASLEKIFLGKNVDSAFKLGHIMGVCLAVAKIHGAEIFEYAARSVKKGVTGSGASEKEQVRFVLKAILNIKIMPALDASDALALAYFHTQNFQVSSMLKKQNKKEVSL